MSSSVETTFWMDQLVSLAVAGYTGMGMAASFSGSMPGMSGSSSSSWNSGLVSPREPA